jgi:hypothetical protein
MKRGNKRPVFPEVKNICILIREQEELAMTIQMTQKMLALTGILLILFMIISNL